MLDELDRKSSLGLPWRVEEAYAAAAGAGAAGRREPATKRLTAARLLPQFVIRIAGFGRLRVVLRVTLGAPSRCWGRTNKHTHRGKARG
jgi:hypothetical protein